LLRSLWHLTEAARSIVDGLACEHDLVDHGLVKHHEKKAGKKADDCRVWMLVALNDWVLEVGRDVVKDILIERVCRN
jgi:hypothetical protein